MSFNKCWNCGSIEMKEYCPFTSKCIDCGKFFTTCDCCEAPNCECDKILK